MKTPFQQRFSQLLIESGMTQEEFSSKLGVTRVMVSNYCTGRSTPPLDTLCEIAKRCDVSIDWLTGMSDVRAPLSTIAAHRENEDTLDLPPEALESIEAFKKEIRRIYGKK